MDSADAMAFFIKVVFVIGGPLMGGGLIWAGWRGMLAGSAPLELKPGKRLSGIPARIVNAFIILLGCAIVASVVLGVIAAVYLE